MLITIQISHFFQSDRTGTVYLLFQYVKKKIIRKKNLFLVLIWSPVNLLRERGLGGAAGVMGDCTFSLTLIDSMLSGGSGLVLFGGTCPAHLSGAPAISRIVLVISREKRFGVTRGPAGPDSWNRRENTRKSRLTIVLYFGLIRFHCHNVWRTLSRVDWA